MRPPRDQDPRPRLWRGRLRGCLEGAPQASPSWSLGCGPWADVPCTAHNTRVALEHTVHTRDGTHMHTLHGGHTCWHTPTHCAVHTCDGTHTFCIEHSHTHTCTVHTCDDTCTLCTHVVGPTERCAHMMTYMHTVHMCDTTHAYSWWDACCTVHTHGTHCTVHTCDGTLCTAHVW